VSVSAAVSACGDSSDDVQAPGCVVPDAQSPTDSSAIDSSFDAGDAGLDANTDGSVSDASVDSSVKSDAADATVDADAAVDPQYQLDCSSNPGLLHPIFTDHMVLQRDAAVRLWGCATADSAVSVTFGAQTLSTKASASGLWHTSLSPMKEGGPYVLSVKSGVLTKTVTDVLVGDLWLCSGQSNMALTVNQSMNATAEASDSVKYPTIRLLTVPGGDSQKPRHVFDGTVEWKVAGATTVPNFSAACYFFGRELSKSLKVPMGLINSSVGGTVIEWWMSEKSLGNDPDYGTSAAAVAAGNLPDGGTHYVTGLFNGKISPLVPFTLRGMVWYQGESNTGRANQYQRLLSSMIQDWRDQFANNDAPFLVVQLPAYLKDQTTPSEGGWAWLREAQLRAYQSTPHVGLAVTIDTGYPTDADAGIGIHPVDKQDVGERLALSARSVAYGQSIAGIGPIYKSMKIEGKRIRLSFDNAGTSLMVGEKTPLQPVKALPSGTLQGFAVATAEQKFYWATAKIEGTEVVVSSDSVDLPVAVRYGWGNNPPCNLYSADGLPASPFRTDSW